MVDHSQESRSEVPTGVTIAISYRHSDTKDIATQIYTRLSASYGRDAILFDIENIPLAVDFRRYIDRTLEDADVVLAIIGRAWMGNADNSRIKDKADFVRLELEAAFRREIPIVPILIDGSTLALDELPTSLRELPFRNGIAITSACLDSDLKYLLQKA